jgi:hypothetical protein
MLSPLGLRASQQHVCCISNGTGLTPAPPSTPQHAATRLLSHANWNSACGGDNEQGQAMLSPISVQVRRRRPPYAPAPGPALSLREIDEAIETLKQTSWRLGLLKEKARCDPQLAAEKLLKCPSEAFLSRIQMPPASESSNILAAATPCPLAAPPVPRLQHSELFESIASTKASCFSARVRRVKLTEQPTSRKSEETLRCGGSKACPVESGPAAASGEDGAVNSPSAALPMFPTAEQPLKVSHFDFRFGSCPYPSPLSIPLALMQTAAHAPRYHRPPRCCFRRHHPEPAACIHQPPHALALCVPRHVLMPESSRLRHQLQNLWGTASNRLKHRQPYPNSRPIHPADPPPPPPLHLPSTSHYSMKQQPQC